MTLRILLMMALVFVIAGCNTPKKKKKDPAKKPQADMQDMSGDMTFQAFIGRLNKGVALHDMQTVASMMTSNFGYRLEPPGEGEGVFQYWDENNMWPALQAILSQRFVPKGKFMVAPPQFAVDSQYDGFRAGMTLVGGSWKFAYFVKD